MSFMKKFGLKGGNVSFNSGRNDWTINIGGYTVFENSFGKIIVSYSSGEGIIFRDIGRVGENDSRIVSWFSTSSSGGGGGSSSSGSNNDFNNFGGGGMSPSQLNAFLDNLASKSPKPTQKRFGEKKGDEKQKKQNRWDDVKKWTKENKAQLLAVTQLLQKTGDQMTSAGLTYAAVGAVATAPVGGEGGLPGLTFAGFGSGVNGIGKVSEVIVKLIADDSEGAADGATYATGEAASFAINQLLHIPQSATPFVNSLFKVGKQTTEKLAGDTTENIIKELRK